MTEWSELFLNPVTVIAILLALFFVAMTYFRHLGVKHARQEQNRGGHKPYQVTNPYAPPAPVSAAPLDAPAAPQRLDQAPPRKVFRQIGRDPAVTGARAGDSSGYVWE